MNKNIIKNSIIEFGMYPQSLMTKDVKIVSTSPDENGYYTGSDGEKYVLQKASPCDNCMTFSNNEKIEKDSTMAVNAMVELRKEYGVTFNDSDIESAYNKYINYLINQSRNTTK